LVEEALRARRPYDFWERRVCWRGGEAEPVLEVIEEARIDEAVAARGWGGFGRVDWREEEEEWLAELEV
jgi:hypothetical protein